MKILLPIISVVAVLLGGLWLLQGLGLVHIRPILCFANCEPVQGPSTGWVIAGLVVMLVGISGIVRSARRHSRA